MSSEDIDELLELWNTTKQKITELEKKCDKYKAYVEKLMEKRNINILSGTQFTVNRTEVKRTSISRKDVPLDIWNKYANNNTYFMYHLKKLK